MTIKGRAVCAPKPLIAAIATAPGRGGIGVVRISGDGVDAVVDGVIAHPLKPRMATWRDQWRHGQCC